jgi:hypothetical protein
VKGACSQVSRINQTLIKKINEKLALNYKGFKNLQSVNPTKKSNQSIQSTLNHECMKRNAFKPLILCLLAGLMAMDSVLFAQCPVSALAGGGGTSANARAPSVRYRLAQAHYLITPAEMAAAGFVAGQQFSQIGWRYNTAPGLTGAGTLQIWFENTADNTNQKSTTWSTAISGMTQVHNANTTLPNTTSPFFITLNNGSAFTYTGQGLYVAFLWQYCTGTLSTSTVVDCNTSLSNSLYQAQSTTSCSPAATLATSTAFRPATWLTPSAFNNDAKVDLIYTYGSVPNVFTIGHQIQARITNVGINPFSGNVTLNITGANTFSDTQVISSLAPCSSTVVTFSGFTPTSTGTNNISVSVPSDDNNSNNIITMNQPVTTNLYSYKYENVPLTGGVGFNPGVFGVFVSKFDAGVPASVNEVKVDFQASTASRFFRIAIYDEVAGQPGNLLYVSPSVITISSAAQQAFIPISPPVAVSGNFYAGVVQETSNTVNIAFSYQSENPTRIGSFFFSNNLTGGPWTDFGTPTVIPFRTAIEVQFYVPSPPNCAFLISPADGATTCFSGTTLTWASGGGGPTAYKVYFGTNFSDVSSENPAVLVQNSPATSYATGPLFNNTTYYWKVVPYNNDGDASGCTVRSFTTNLISCYCTSTATNGNYEYIQNVQSGTFSNPSGSSLYANYTGLGPINTIPATPGTTFTVTVTMPTALVYDEDRIFIFCDFNQDGDWNDAGELCGNADVTIAGGNVYNVVCTVGAGVVSGQTVLRIKLGDEVFGSPPMNNNPCQPTFTYGEVEDYLIQFACGVTVSSNQPVCEGETLQLNATYSGSSTPVSWSWSGPNGFSSTLEDPTRPNMTLADAGNYTVTVTDAASCTASASLTVNVAPLPNAQASSNAPICEGDALTLNAQPNGMLFYQWTGPNGFSSFAQNPLVTNNASAVLHAGVYTVTVTSSFLCSASATVNVVINPLPVPYIITQTNVSCFGGNNGSVTVGSTGTPPFLFDWGFNNFYGSTVTITNLSAQTFSVNVTDDNGCISNPDLQVTITQPPLLSVSASSNSPVCTGQTLNLNASVSGGTPGYGYQWAGPGGFSSSVQNPSLSNVTLAAAGVYTVTVTDNNSCTATASTTVTVNQSPVATLSGGGLLCLGNSGTVTLNFSGPGPWSGTVSDGVNSVSFGPTTTNPLNVSVTPTLTGVRTYTVTALSNANCTGSSSGSAVFTVSSAPPTSTVQVVNAPASACSSTVALVTTNIVSGQNIQYSWNVGTNSSVVLFSTSSGGPFSPGPFVTSTNQVYAQFGALGAFQSGYNICVQGINGCGSSNNKCTWVRGAVSTPGPITGPTVVCSGATNQVYSVSSPLPAGVQTFVWSFSVQGAVITPVDPPLNSQVSINFPAFSSGTLSVQAGLSCLASSLSPARTLAISNSTVTPAVPSGPNKVCPGSSYTYSVPAVAGAATYNWSVPSNASIIAGAGTNSITVQFAATPINFVNGIISVNVTSICGVVSGTSSRTVSSLVPSTPGAMSGSTTGVCNSTQAYSVPAVSGVTYSWSLPAGASGFSTTNAIAVTFSNTFGSGTISVTATAAGCAVASNPRTLNVSGVPATPSSITVPFAPCNGGPGQFQTTAVAGATSYIWTVPANGTTIDNGQGTTTIDVTWGTGPGNVTVQANNSCGSSGLRTLYFVPGCRLGNEETAQMNVNSLTVYPNPAHTQAMILFRAEETGSYQVMIRDVTGRIIRCLMTEAESGVHQLQINLSDMARGMYLIEVRLPQGSQRQKLLLE